MPSANGDAATTDDRPNAQSMPCSRYAVANPPMFPNPAASPAFATVRTSRRKLGPGTSVTAIATSANARSGERSMTRQRSGGAGQARSGRADCAEVGTPFS